MYLKSWQRAIAPFGFFVLCAITGCGESSGSVKGKVYLKEQLVTAGRVAFTPPNDKIQTAQIQADGSYQIQKVAVGLSKISVTAPVAVAAPEGKSMIDPAKMGAGDKGRETEGAKGKVVPIPAMYGDPDKSGQTYTVKSGSQEYDIKLP